MENENTPNALKATLFSTDTLVAEIVAEEYGIGAEGLRDTMTEIGLEYREEDKFQLPIGIHKISYLQKSVRSEFRTIVEKYCPAVALLK